MLELIAPCAWLLLLTYYSLFSRSGKSEVVYNWLYCFDIDWLQIGFEEAGLRVQSVYSDVCGNDYDSAQTEFAVVEK